MHPSPIFRSNDKPEVLDFISTYPFATLAVNGPRGPVTSLVPLVIDQSRQNLLGHVARANPFWKVANESKLQAVAVFRGGDGYVSPSSYPSKKEHGKTVPTWNYMAVEIRGGITFETQPNKMLPFLTALTDKMESHRDMPWQVSDAPDEYIEKLSRAIIGFSFEIDDITFVKKLSQNKSDTDKEGVRHAFENSSDPMENILAHEMNEGLN